MKAFITGVSGFIGSQLADSLVEAGWRVAGIDRDPERRAVNGEVEFLPGDIREPDAWRRLLDDVDVVFHSAAVHHVDSVSAHPARSIDINLRGTRSMLEAATGADVPQFVLLSSAKVYGSSDEFPSREADLVAPIESYGLAKVVCESYIGEFASRHGLRATAVRPFSVYGPGQDLSTGYIGALLQGFVTGFRALLPGEPHYRRDFVHVDDVVRLCVALTDHPEPPRIVNAASGASVELRDAESIMAGLIDRPLEIEYERPRPGTVLATHGAVATMTQVMGRDPIQLGAGLASTIAWADAIGP